jgi:hypothetical protein
MKTTITQFVSTLAICFSISAYSQTGSNTFPYPDFGSIGVGTTDIDGYKLTTSSNLFEEIIFMNEEPFVSIAKIPFQIIGREDAEAEFNLDILSEAWIYQGEEDTKVYTLFKDGAITLGYSTNYTPPTFSYSLATDNSIYTKGNLLTDSKIGIGTTAPITALDLRIGDMSLSDNKIYLRGPADKNHYLSFMHTYNGVLVDGPQLVGYRGGMLGSTSGGFKGVLYWRDDEVGINVQDPSKELEVNGEVKFDGDNSDDEIQFEPHNGFHRIAFNTLRFHEWGVGDVLNIKAGKIGIGEISPQEALDINGNFRSNTSATANAITVFNNSINSVDFLVKGNGHVYAREIDVKLSAFPDYVFEKNYELMSLKDLGAFIKKENHLPGVKSAAEVKSNGIGLGELSRIQMGKIEELTLYILQQEERIKKLEELIKTNKTSSPTEKS